MIGRFIVIDLSAGPCTYGKIETEEGSVSYRTLPRLRNIMFPRGFSVASDHSTHDIFVGQLASLISTTIEHVIAPDIRYLQLLVSYCYFHLKGCLSLLASELYQTLSCSFIFAEKSNGISKLSEPHNETGILVTCNLSLVTQMRH